MRRNFGKGTKTRKGSGAGRPSPQDTRKVPYPELRDRLLASSETTDRVAWLVEVGRFVEDRWLAEEQARNPGEDLDENALWDLWDECSEKYIRDLRTEARELLQKDLQRKRARAFAIERLRAVEPARTVAAALAWIVAQMFRAVVGAIGVIAFGVLLVSLYPGLVQTLHSTFDKAFPRAEQTETPGAHVNSNTDQ